MSVQSEITRIQTARNTLRTKAVSLGIGLNTDTLDTLATKYDGITDRGTPNAEVQEGQSYTIQAGYYHGGTVQGVSGGGNYTLQSKTVTPTKEEISVTKDDGYYGLSSVTVNPIPDAYQDVTDVTAVASDVLAGKVYVPSSGVVTTGTMQNRGAVSATLNKDTTSYTVPAGYHNGSGTVSITTETKTATPTESSQDIEPTSGKLLTKVTVNPIPDKYGDASGTDAVAANILSGKIAIGYDSTNQEAIELTGTMTNNGAVSTTLNKDTTSYTVPEGYHNGSGTVSITTETKTATPSTSSQDIEPTSGKLLTKVTVEAIPDTYMDATDKTVTPNMLLEGETAIGYDSDTGEAIEVTGTMPNNNAVSATLNTTTTSYTVPAGYHNGSGTVSITTETKTATPSTSSQSITPTSGKVLSEVTVNAIPNNYGDATGKDATAADVLSGKTAIGYDSDTGAAVSITGSMTNNGAVSPTSLLCGESYTVPAGYHNGSGRVSAASLASQTGVDTGKTAISATYVVADYQGWVNGTKVTGSMSDNGAITATITGLGSVAGDTSYTIPAGYHNGSGTVSLTNSIETALAAI